MAFVTARPLGEDIKSNTLVCINNNIHNPFDSAHKYANTFLYIYILMIYTYTYTYFGAYRPVIY